MDTEEITSDLNTQNHSETDKISQESIDTQAIVSETISETVITEPSQDTQITQKQDDIEKENIESTAAEENPTETVENSPLTEDPNNKITRPCQFAISRIKTIMKCDPDLAIASKESVFAIAKATVNYI